MSSHVIQQKEFTICIWPKDTLFADHEIMKKLLYVYVCACVCL